MKTRAWQLTIPSRNSQPLRGPDQDRWVTHTLQAHRRHRYYATRSLASEDIKSDVLIVGTGAAGLTAALRAAHHGLRPLIIEKSAKIGGTSAWSGGGLWIPNSHLHTSPGSDSQADALTYLEHVVGEVGPVSSRKRKLAFLENGPKMARWLEDVGFEWTLAHGYPDYFPEKPGGRAGGRTIEPKVFDMKKLVAWKDLVERSPVRANVPVYSYEGARLIRAKTGWDGWMTALRVLSLRWPWEKLMGREPVTLGQSLVAQLLHLVLKRDIPIWRKSPLKDVMIEDGHVKGAIVLKDGEKETTIITKNVILAAGGFASNSKLREKYQSLPSSYTNASPHDTGDALSLSLKHNLAITLLDDSWWGPTTIDPATGRTYWCQFERSLPHSIIVDKKGERFTNESKNYNAVGHDIIARNKAEPGSAVPAFLIMDAKHRSRYMLAAKFLPGITPQSAIDSGFIFKAATLKELAGQLGIDAESLEKTVQRFNSFAATGIDADFHRGQSAYDRYFGDTTSSYRKNLNLGSVEQAPFYAVKVWPGDLGTKGGVVTDEYSRALKEEHGELKPMEGLYAVGNSSASVMGRTYAGAGATLGPAMSFAFVAADHIGGRT